MLIVFDFKLQTNTNSMQHLSLDIDLQLTIHVLYEKLRIFNFDIFHPPFASRNHLGARGQGAPEILQGGRFTSLKLPNESSAASELPPRRLYIWKMKLTQLRCEFSKHRGFFKFPFFPKAAAKGSFEKSTVIKDC